MKNILETLKIDPRNFENSTRHFQLGVWLNNKTNLLEPFFVLTDSINTPMETLKLEFEFTSKVGFSIIYGYSDLYLKQGFFEKVVEDLERCIDLIKMEKNKTLLVLPSMHKKENNEVLIKEVGFIMTDINKTPIKVLSSVEF